MRFKGIRIQNMRLIGDEARTITASDDKNVLILLGNNGVGKTTVLDAIAMSVAPFVAQFPQNSDRLPTDFDVHIDGQGHTSSHLTIESTFSLPEGEKLCSRRHRRGRGKAPESDIRAIKAYAQRLKEDIVAGNQQVTLPVLAYYGTGRGQIKAPERKRSFQKTFERWDCYRSSLTPDTDFKTFFQWFDLMEDEERRTREQLRNFEYTSPVLDAVREAISGFMPQRFSNPHIEIHPLRFVMDEREGDTCRQLRIEQMSDGYKIVLAMVADIASRMAEANPGSSHVLHTPGIVLIDEVDLHLHPKWQREIIRQLTHVFPNVQFIVSTHSPIIVVGAADLAQVVKLEEDDVPTDLSKQNIGQVLLGSLFDLESLFSPLWDDDFRRRDELLAKPELSGEEQDELKVLNKKLSALSVTEDLNVIRSNQLVDLIAGKLGIEL